MREVAKKTGLLTFTYVFGKKMREVQKVETLRENTYNLENDGKKAPR